MSDHSESFRSELVSKILASLPEAQVREILAALDATIQGYEISRKPLEIIPAGGIRRTLITFLLNRGMPIQEVMILAGHSKADTTMRYYSCNKARIKNSYMVHTT